MGVSASSEQNQDELGRLGFHVLSIIEDSPADRAGIEPFFDFIVSINKQELGDATVEESEEKFKQMLVSNQDQKISIGIYSSKYQNCRELEIVPSLDWGGQTLLGCSVQLCSFNKAGENVWHVVSVFSDSPASKAGLEPEFDYIIGSPHQVLAEKEELFDLIESSLNSPLRLFVYNWKHDTCREVDIVPDSQWGGEGCLGCDIGHGYLHRIPKIRYQEWLSQKQSNTDK